MDNEKLIDRLKPDRIMKLYGGKKTSFGTKRLFVVGIGKNGTECLMRCKHIAENRYNIDNGKLRFLAIGEDRLLDGAEFCGSTLSDGEKLRIVPDEAIYKYLNAPERLPETALSWFDTGLKNYTPAKPVYGLQKRQCGRVALFHYFNELLKIIGDAISAFSTGTAPLDVVVVGNMGDAMFGGMIVDMGYILNALFGTAKYPVKVAAYMFAGDTTKLFEKDSRELGNYYANTIVTKAELDSFQCRKTRFSQKYTQSFSIDTDKTPYAACYINAAESTLEATLENAALKILSELEIVYKRDDDADKIMSYNMLGKEHSFRYLSYDTAVNEIPVGKIMSYLAVRMFMSFSRMLNKNSVSGMEMGKLIGKLTPNAEFLAAKGGQLPKLDFDERTNPLFGVKSLKNGMEASRRYVGDNVEQFAELCKKGAQSVLPSVLKEVTAVCESAKNDFDKGPFYAVEVVKKSLAELRSAIAKNKSEAEEIGADIAREERMVKTSYKKIKNSPMFIAARATGEYIAWLEEWGEYKKTEVTLGVVGKFYETLYAKIDEYYRVNLLKSAEMFEQIPVNRDRILSEPSPYEGYGAAEAFDIGSPEIRKILDKMVDELPESTRLMAFKRSDLMNADKGDELHFPRELVNIVQSCFSSFFEQSYDEFCRFFGAESSEAAALGECLERVGVKTPATDEPPLTRILCPKDAPAGEIAPIRAVRKGISDLWNDSAASCSVSAVQIKGSVTLKAFKGYEQWENMRYAYVNDSLKKHGIHIF
ncbi:MAG: tubulin-like doman-containing protein [Lachnospiraceae bacterium]|nr:tubulin-like doman-containing protein [Ruminococcus sp.]MCM1275730.1 tubulin-like doman-containing protein [Lachnospiraceae bacterium]